MSTSFNDGMSAVVYTRLYRQDFRSETNAVAERDDCPPDEGSAPWLSLVKTELTPEDWLTVNNSTDMVVELAMADETRALKVARLIRNGYQINRVCGDGVRLIIAVVMFEAEQTPSREFVRKARQLVVNENIGSGNKILLQYRGSNENRLH